MPRTATITVTDLQKVSANPKSPYTIETSEGVTYKAWDAVGRTMRRGEAYAVSYDEKENGEYGMEFMLRKVSLATREDVKAAGGGGPGHVMGGATAQITIPIKTPSVDWAAKEEDMATLAMFKSVWRGADEGSIAQCLDECRSEWKAHKHRMKAPRPELEVTRGQNVNLPPSTPKFLGPEGDTEEF